jgi:ABC-type amino acid transport substrate-binding protein
MNRSHGSFWALAALRVSTALLTLLVALVATAWPSDAAAQDGTTPTPVPLATLVQPTPLPPAPTATATPLPADSALARIITRTSANNRHILIVGLPYNIPPFARITEIGVIEGFEADVARAVSEDWGVDIEFRQVTRHNGLAMLLGGQIDLLMGKLMLTRNQGREIDFSTPYFANRQVALALFDAPQQDIRDLGGQAVGVVIGSRGEEALTAWVEANGLQISLNRYAMLDDALRALADRQIVALVGDRWELDQRVGAGKVGGIKLLNGAFRVEPYAFAFVRHDASLRTLLERSLQRLAQSGRFEAIYERWFNQNDLLPEDKLIPRPWRNLDGDKRTLIDFPTNIFRPSQPVVERIQSGGPLRVAGLGEPLNAQGTQSPLEAFNRAMIEEMARRWGVPIAYVPNSYGVGEDLLATGQADVAVGMEARWTGADRVEFAGIYAQRGYRMMVRVGSEIRSFGALAEGRREIGVFSGDTTGFELAKSLVKSVYPDFLLDSLRRFDYASEQDAVDAVFTNNVRLFFGDAFRLIPAAAANTARVYLTDTLYDPRPVAFGLPYNDVDFRVLIDVTLQEMVKDGTYATLFQSTFRVGDPLPVVMWPGTPILFGIKTSR